MTIGLNSNVAAPNANSYVSLAEMDRFVEERPPGADRTAWKGLTENNRERWLVQAALAVDRAHSYLGRRITDLTDEEPQALEFPRASFIYRGGKNNIEAYRTGAAYEVDERVKLAQMAQALYMAYQSVVAGAPLPMGGTVRAQLQAEGVTSIQIGNTSESYSGKAMALCAEAEAYLKPLRRRATRI